MIPARPFPVLNPPAGCPTHVIWSSLNADRAQKIHGTTLARLAQRGGLTITEIFANVRGIALRDVRTITHAEALDLVQRIADDAHAA